MHLSRVVRVITVRKVIQQIELRIGVHEIERNSVCMRKRERSGGEIKDGNNSQELPGQISTHVSQELIRTVKASHQKVNVRSAPKEGMPHILFSELGKCLRKE